MQLQTVRAHKIQRGNPASAYKGPDLRCSFRGLWPNQRRGSREFPSDGVGLALLDGPPGRRPDGGRRLLLAADPDGRGAQPWPGSWDGGAAPKGRMAMSTPSLEHLNVGGGEGDGGRHDLAATSTPIRWIPQTWSAIGNYILSSLSSMLNSSTKIGSGILRVKEIRGIGDCCVQSRTCKSWRRRRAADGGRGVTWTLERTRRRRGSTRGEFGEASNRLILWPRFADGDARLVDQRLAFLCRHLPNVCQFHLLSIQL